MLSTTQTERVLIADDDENVRALLSAILTRGGYEVVEARDGWDALEKITPDVGVVLLDNIMPRLNGIECLARLRENNGQAETIMLSVGGVSNAVAAMQQGAFWYLQKPVNPAELLVLVQKASETARLKRQSNELLGAVAESPVPCDEGSSYLLPRNISNQIGKIASMDCSILITGETGTGKSTLARQIHQRSNRTNGPFVAISCAAMPRDLLEAELFGYEKGAFTGEVKSRPGRFEIADNGTLFLDEIGDMALDLQPKLLLFLENRMIERLGSNRSKKINARIISATLQNLDRLCADKQFREDLYFRLKVFAITIPPIRERRDELSRMVGFTLRKLEGRYGLSEMRLDGTAMKKVMDYHWPGNIRELENVLERAVLLTEGTTIPAEMILAEHQVITAVGNEIAAGALAGIPLSVLEQRAISDTLALCGGNKREAARRLGISEKSVYNKLHRMGL